MNQPHDRASYSLETLNNQNATHRLTRILNNKIIEINPFVKYFICPISTAPPYSQTSHTSKKNDVTIVKTESIRIMKRNFSI